MSMRMISPALWQRASGEGWGGGGGFRAAKTSAATSGQIAPFSLRGAPAERGRVLAARELPPPLPIPSLKFYADLFSSRHAECFTNRYRPIL
jgi:hypothetical protein